MEASFGAIVRVRFDMRAKGRRRATGRRERHLPASRPDARRAGGRADRPETGREAGRFASELVAWMPRERPDNIWPDSPIT